jgi:CheY-like chemotaxis protein
MDALSPRRQILIVEDNRALAKGMSIILKLEGYDVEVAHEGREALRVSRAHPPDIVLLDIGLPGMDGFQIAEEMRRDPDLKDVKIIAISGYDQEIFTGRADSAKFDHVLIKPIDFDNISALLAGPI